MVIIAADTIYRVPTFYVQPVGSAYIPSAIIKPLWAHHDAPLHNETFDVGTPFLASAHNTDNEAIVYIVNSMDEPGLYAISADSSAEPALLIPCDGLCRQPTQDESGQRIGFIDGDSIVVFDHISGEASRIPVDMGTYDYNAHPAWTNDLRYVVYAARVDMRNILRVTAIDTGETRDLDAVPGGAFWPDWVDEGERIVFASGNRLYLLDINTSELHPLTPEDEQYDFPVVGPDSKQLLYRQLLPGNVQVLVMADVVIDDDGVPSLENAQTLIEGVLDAPAWAPDGEQASVLHWSADGVSLIIINLNTGDMHTVAANAMLNQWPAWSQDSGTLAYMGLDADVPQLLTLYSVPADGSGDPTALVTQVDRAAGVPGGLAWGRPNDSEGAE